MPYGYLGQNTPNQTVSNSGVFSISDVASLEKQGKFGGSLELIAEQTCTGYTTLEFTNIKETVYDVHLLQYIGLKSASDMYNECRVSNDNGTSYEVSGYRRAVQYGSTTGTFGENRTLSTSRFGILAYATAGTPISNYVYLYNLGNPSKYSFITHHSTVGNEWMYFGSQVYEVAETINALQILNSASATWTNGKVKLYGLKQL
jgi:hypothetical protein